MANIEKQPFERVHSLAVRPGIVSEVPDMEIEIKHELPKKVDSEVLAQTIFDTFRGSKDGSFRVAKSFPMVAEIKTRQLKYVDSAKNQPLFTVVLHEMDGAIIIKRKGPKADIGSVEVVDETKDRLPEKAWTPELEKKVISDQSKNLGVPVEAVKLEREEAKLKLAVRVENSETHRVYTVGVVTKTAPDRKPRRFLSIEYFGRDTSEASAREETKITAAIKKDILEIDRRIQSVEPRIEAY